jgi:hypothetical protein
MENESLTLRPGDGAMVPYKPLLPPEDMVAVAATKHVRARLRYATCPSLTLRPGDGAMVPYKPLLPPEDMVAVAATKHVRARLRYATCPSDGGV